MKEFYLSDVDAEKWPRVFGMTASPVDAKVNVVKAAKYAQNVFLKSSRTKM